MNYEFEESDAILPTTPLIVNNVILASCPFIIPNYFSYL